MRHLKQAIEERRRLVLEDRAALALHASAAKQAALAKLGTPVGVAGGFGGGLLVGYLRCRCERAPAEDEQAAPQSTGHGVSGLLSWVLRHFGWAIATALLEQHQDQGEAAPEAPYP